jgi:hypothetical protein
VNQPRLPNSETFTALNAWSGALLRSKEQKSTAIGIAPPDLVIPGGFLTGHAQWTTRIKRVLIGVELAGRACEGSRNDPLPDRLLGCFLLDQVVRGFGDDFLKRAHWCQDGAIH